MATPGRMQTRSKNATTRPALPVLQLNEELDDDRKAERASKRRKAAEKKQQKELVLAKELTTLEQHIAGEDAIDDTPRPLQSKAPKPATSKLRHVHMNPITSDSETSNTDEPPVFEDESDTPTDGDKQSSVQEWTESSNNNTSADDSEDSHSNIPRSKKQPPVNKKRLVHTRKKLAKPPDQEPAIDFVEDTPVPKRRPKARAVTKAVEFPQNSEARLPIPTKHSKLEALVGNDDSTPKANRRRKRQGQQEDLSTDEDTSAAINKSISKRPRKIPTEVGEPTGEEALDDNPNNAHGPTQQQGAIERGGKTHAKGTRQSGNGKTNKSGSREMMSGGHGSAHGKQQGTTRKTSDRGTDLSNREASRGQLDNPLDDVADWAAKVPAKGLRRIGTITPTPTLASGSEGTQRSSAMATSLVSSRSASGGKVGVRSTASGLSDANEEHSKEPEDVSKGKRKGRASSSAPESTKRARKRPKNANMPAEAHINNAWRNKVIPTLYQWAGTQSDPWILGDSSLRDALRAIGEAVYGDLDLGLDDVEEDIPGKHPSYTQGDAFGVATQRLSEWRNCFSSAALSVLVTFFEYEQNRHRFATDEDRKTFAIGQLKEYRFLYKTTGNGEQKTFKGLFRGPLVLQTFASHINAMSGAVQAPGLYPGNKVPVPHGALGLAAAAVERVLKIIAEGAITIGSIKDDRENNRTIKPIAQPNPETGKISNNAFAFSAVAWGKVTRSWAKNALNRFNTDKMNKIYDEAKIFERAANKRQFPTGESESEDERALLSEAPSSDDE